MDFGAAQSGGDLVPPVDEDVGDSVPDDDGDVASDDDGVTYLVQDEFDREVSSGFGTPTSGGAPYVCIFNPSTTARVSGGLGFLNVISTGPENSIECDLNDDTPRDLEIEAIVSGSNGAVTLYGRSRVNFVHYHLTVGIGSGTDNVTLARTRDFVYVTFGSTAPLAESTSYNVRFRVQGPPTSTVLTAWVWPVGTSEPTTATLSATDTDGFSGGGVGVGAWTTAGQAFGLTIDALRVREL